MGGRRFSFAFELCKNALLFGRKRFPFINITKDIRATLSGFLKVEKDAPVNTSFLTKMLKCLVVFTLVFVSIEGFSITDNVAEPRDPKVGGKVRLKCRSSGWFEYCTWKHNDWVCEFEWKWSHDAVKKTSCTALGNRARFVGTYDSHECEIEISNVTLADAGRWSCEMEAHVSGLVRGTTDKAYIDLNVRNDVTTATTTSRSPTDSTTTTSTTTSSTETTTSIDVLPRIETTTDGKNYFLVVRLSILFPTSSRASCISGF